MSSFNKKLLETGIQNFIFENIDTDIVSLLLKKQLFDHVSNKELAQQLESRKKCEKKLPTWFKTQKIYYPKPLNIEQTSSEITADYKLEIIGGKSIIDLSGGLGVDSYFFAKKFQSVLHCEIDPELSQIAQYNFEILGASNIETIVANGIDFLKERTIKPDWLFIDPSRRDKIKGKVIKLEDCQPDIPSNLALLFEKSDKILLKTSPLLDLQAGILSLRFVREIHIVALANEVKELLWVMEKGFSGEPLIETINSTQAAQQVFSFYLSEEKSALPIFSMPRSYLYEPNAALMKSGAFKYLTKYFKIDKLHASTHLYTSDELIEFPGRRFKIERFLPYNAKSIKKLNLTKSNISTRNFPDSVKRIKSKYGIKDGGSHYLFFCRCYDNRLGVLKCSKI